MTQDQLMSDAFIHQSYGDEMEGDGRDAGWGHTE